VTKKAIAGTKISECIGELIMDEDVFNTSIRKFLKSLGVTAQREIEKTVRQAVAERRLKGDETLPAKATVSIGQLNFTFDVDGQIELK
jgi:Family of unknown function (DUF6494)